MKWADEMRKWEAEEKHKEFEMKKWEAEQEERRVKREERNRK